MIALMAERIAPDALEVGATAPTARAKGDASRVPDDGDAAVSALAHRAVLGDQRALAALVHEHAGAIATLCHHVAGAADAKDAAQESLLRIVRELPRFDAARGSFRGWATTVARNVCRDRLRRRGLERGAFAADGDARTELAEDGRPDAERLVIAREGAASLARALEGLPAPMREAILMFHVGDATYEEIAVALDVPMGTVMTWLHRGRQRLRAAVEEP